MKYFKKHIVPYILSTLLLGTFMAFIADANYIEEYIFSYLFWMMWLAPLLSSDEKEEQIIPIKYEFNYKTNRFEKV